MTEVKYNIGNGRKISVEYDEHNITKITKECFEMLIEKKINGGWIPIKTRPMTSEECEEYGVDDGYIYDCPLPDGGDEVLISTKWGVEKTTFYTDDGYYFEQYEDDGDVLAWMPLPEPYKGSEVEE